MSNLRSLPHYVLASAVLVGFVFVLNGCSGKTPLQQQTETVQQSTAQIPDFMTRTPDDPEHLYGTGAGQSQDMQMAVNKAEHNARVQIVQNIEAKVSALFKSFAEETGAGDDAELLSMASGVSKSVASEVIGGVRVKDRKIVPEGGMYRAYVLLEMPIGEAASRLNAQIKANQRLWTRFRASQGFQELDKQAEAYEKFKKEQEQSSLPTPTQ